MVDSAERDHPNSLELIVPIYRQIQTIYRNSAAASEPSVGIPIHNICIWCAPALFPGQYPVNTVAFVNGDVTARDPPTGTKYEKNRFSR